MIKTDKGLDGLMIQFDDGDVARVVICEEKAGKNARQKISGSVWPEFANFETGARDNELVATVTSPSERSGNADADKTISDVLWSDARAFRVAVTENEIHATEAGRRRLFEGFEGVVSGEVMCRRAETFLLDDIRAWIASIAAKAADIEAEAEEQADV